MFYNHVYVYCIVILIHKVVFENLTLGSFTLGRYKGSYRFRVISALKSRENRSLAGIGGRCRHLEGTT
jgi:hypothetical protein